ncbi:spherulin-1A [Phlyctema vagabunda]|uniref:Spherulin-1A n=1 Tax=Phlyctema vagabunda TaxID=108571 RepID=A0ABR4PM72_9HELO
MISKIYLVVGVLVGAVAAVDKTVDPDKVAALKLSATDLDRAQEQLATDEDWLFDFNSQPLYTYSPGSVVNANAATFPAMTGHGMTVAMLNLGPCAMLPPHYHPRATNMVVAIEGTTNTYMVQENGARTVAETLTPGKMTIFPKGSLHTMQNTGCGNATLVSSLNSEDTGTLNILNGLWSVPHDMILAAFGHGAAVNLTAYGQSIPPPGTGSVLGSAQCLEACRKQEQYVQEYP